MDSIDKMLNEQLDKGLKEIFHYPISRILDSVQEDYREALDEPGQLYPSGER